MSGKKLSRKEKKKLQRLKNRKIWERFLMTQNACDQLERDGGLSAPEYEADIPPEKSEIARKRERHSKSSLEEIRNRTSQRRMRAQERWNRFAATADAGGRGL